MPIALTHGLRIAAAAALLATLGCGAGGQANGPDAETVALAEQLGMTPEELQAKKAMLVYGGLTAEEVNKTLMMGGDPASLFKDDAPANRPAPTSIDQLTFASGDGETEVKLAGLLGKRNVVLVFTRGYYNGSICPFCTTQTAQLAANKEAFEERDAEVLVVFPGSGDQLPTFVDAVNSYLETEGELAWPVLLDKDLSAVELLDIAADLAVPSTFIINKEGEVVYSYVGASRTDRPSAAAILAQLDALRS
ncbi:MAG: redoxin domain-containing protein [Planctomycetota bacterium]